MVVVNEEKRESKLDLFLKIGGFILVLIPVIIAVLTYVSEPSERKLNPEKVKVYSEMTDAIGKLLSSHNSGDNETFQSGTQIRRAVDINDATRHELRRIESEKSNGFSQFFGLRDAL